jgi:TonB family protein
MFWWVLCIVILAPAGYFGWQKLQPLRYIHRAPAIRTEPASAPSQPAAPDTSQVNAAPATEPPASSASVPATDSANNSGTPIVANGAPEGFPTKETIDVGQTLDSPEPPITVVPKPEPLQVKQNPVEKIQAQPTPPSVVLPESKATDSALAGIISSNVAVPKAAPGALQVSEGVTQGLLIKKIAPVYPAAAFKLRKQGAVELMATVSKTGTITKVKVLSGDSLLAQAAVDAVRQWKYRPFLLNAEPVDIETQITIKFKLPN